MRILFAVNSLSAGGAESFVAATAKALAKNGHCILIYAYAGILDKKGYKLKDELLRHNIPVVTPKATTIPRKLLVPFHFVWVARRFLPDIIHCNLDQSSLLVMLCALSGSLPKTTSYMRTLHSVYLLPTLPLQLHERIRRFYSVNVACSRQVLAEHPHSNTGKTILIENGIDLDTLSVHVSPQEIRSRHHIPQDAVVFINIGSFLLRKEVLPKSQDVIVEAVSRLRHLNILTLLVGDGPARKMIEDKARAKNVADRIIFFGLTENPLDLILASDIVVMPSRFEGLSIACIECACSGKPMILSNIPAFERFRGPSTISVPPDDASALTNAMAYSARILKHLRVEALARQSYFRDQFDIGHLVSAYENIYLHLSGHSPS